MAASGMRTQPNCCNINLYRFSPSYRYCHCLVSIPPRRWPRFGRLAYRRRGPQRPGRWLHLPKELFEGGYNDICILSLSLGATRTFEARPLGPLPSVPIGEAPARCPTGATQPQGARGNILRGEEGR